MVTISLVLCGATMLSNLLCYIESSLYSDFGAQLPHNRRTIIAILCAVMCVHFRHNARIYSGA